MKIYTIDHSKLLPIGTHGYQHGQEQAKTYLNDIPANAEYTVCIEPSEKALEDAVCRLCGIQRNPHYKMLIAIDDTDNRFNRPSIHMAVYYTDTQGNADVCVVSHMNEFNTKQYALAQKILTLLKESVR